MKQWSLLTLTVFLAACGGTVSETDTASSDAALVNGAIDTNHTWSVGVCAGPLNTDASLGPIGACLTKGTRCTGTLIAPNLVLTARHCVNTIDYSQATDFCTGVYTDEPLTDAGVRITLDRSVLGANVAWTKVTKIIKPSTNGSCADDLVVLKLERSIPYGKAQPVGLDLRDLTRHAPSQVAVVGRGVTYQLFDINTYEVIAEEDGGLQRRVLQHIPFTCVSNTAGVCHTPDIGAEFYPDPGYFVFGNSALSGDSGSSIIRQETFSRWPFTIGVNSAGTVDPVSGLSNFSFGTRLDTHRAYLLGALREASWFAGKRVDALQ